MHVTAKKIAFGGLLLAMTQVCMLLGSVIETNTLFLLAAASYFVGIMIREFRLRTGAAFYAAGVFLGFLLAPDKFYVLTYAAMGFYILAVEAVFRKLDGKMDPRRQAFFFRLAKFVIFNLMYVPILLLSGRLLIAAELTPPFLAGALLAGQAGLFLYDRAYDYVQLKIWGKFRGRFF